MHADADPGHKVLEAQAHAFAAEFLAPSACIQDELPTSHERSRLDEAEGA